MFIKDDYVYFAKHHVRTVAPEDVTRSRLATEFFQGSASKMFGWVLDENVNNATVRVTNVDPKWETPPISFTEVVVTVRWKHTRLKDRFTAPFWMLVQGSGPQHNARYPTKYEAIRQAESLLTSVSSSQHPVYITEVCRVLVPAVIVKSTDFGVAE
jgi:hypothetical protein